MMEPAVLLADEPTAALDPARAAEVKQLLMDEAARLGTATLLVTHDGEDAAGADREVRLGRGVYRDVTCPGSALRRSPSTWPSKRPQ